MESTFKDSITNIRYFAVLYGVYVAVTVGLAVAEVYLDLGVLGILTGLVNVVAGLLIVARIDQEKQTRTFQITAKKAFTVVATEALLVIAVLLVIGLATVLALTGAYWAVVLLGLIAVIPVTMFAWGIHLLPAYTLDTGAGYIRGIVNCYKYVDGYKSYIFWEATKLGFLLGLVPLSVFLLLWVSGSPVANFSKESLSMFESIASSFIAPFMASNMYELYVKIQQDKAPASTGCLLAVAGDDGLAGS